MFFQSNYQQGGLHYRGGSETYPIVTLAMSVVEKRGNGGKFMTKNGLVKSADENWKNQKERECRLIREMANRYRRWKNGSGSACLVSTSLVKK